MTSKDRAELIVRRRFDSWFGESLENMEDMSRVKKYFFDPLVADIAEAIDKATK